MTVFILLFSGMSWIQGNAECLPVQSNTYDAYTIAFGIRNCTHVDKVGNALIFHTFLQALGPLSQSDASVGCAVLLVFRRSRD